MLAIVTVGAKAVPEVFGFHHELGTPKAPDERLPGLALARHPAYLAKKI